MARIVFVSPHLDDAVLSCGGLIAKLSAEHKVEVWTLFCGRPLWPRNSPLVRWLHGISDARNASELLRRRKSEDRHALGIVGVSGMHLPFLDCVYRLQTIFKPLYPSSCIGTPHVKDSRLITAISATLSKLLDAQDILFCPLGIGNHVDHIITRRAVETIGQKEIFYYQDVPYVTSNAAGDLPSSLKEFQVSLRPSDLSCWYNASIAYDSQMQMLDPQKSVIKEYVSQFTFRPFAVFANGSSSETTNSLFGS